MEEVLSRWCRCRGQRCIGGTEVQRWCRADAEVQVKKVLRFSTV